MGGTLAGVGDGSHRSPVLQEVFPNEADWIDVENLIRERSRKYHMHYRSTAMVMRRLWRVRPNQALKDSEQKLSHLGPPTRLFHGTDPGSAENIIQGGFRLPTHSGMFGKGVYFARCPLKSVIYAGAVGTIFAMTSRFRRALLGAQGPVGECKVMLLCNVYLGRQKKERCCWNVSFGGMYDNVVSAKDLRPSFVDAVFCPHRCFGWCLKGGYDSVYAPGGDLLCCNTVAVSEFVVYDPGQAIPLFLLEFDVDKAPAQLVGDPVKISA